MDEKERKKSIGNEKQNQADLWILFCFVEANICRHRLPKRIRLARRLGLCSFSDADGLFIFNV